MAKNYCVGCEKDHEDWAWKYSNEFEGWLCTKYHKPSGATELITEEIADQRKEYFNSTLQPYRGGELSKEYVEAHGLKGTNATKEEAKKAKYLWKDLPNWENRAKTK